MGDPQLNPKKIMEKVKKADIEKKAFERQQMFGESYPEAHRIAKKQIEGK